MPNVHSRRGKPYGQFNQNTTTSSLISLLLIVCLLISSGCEAIVKQAQQTNQQSRSDESQQVSTSSQAAQNVPQSSNGYNNHQTNHVSQSQSYSSPSSANSQSGSSSQSQSNPSPSSSSMSSSLNSQQQSGRSEQFASMQPKQNYGNAMTDSMVANNPESYQAAATSVNMALANSGIYNYPNNQQLPSSSIQPQGSAANSQSSVSSSSSSSSSSLSSSSSPSGSQSLNPLHYFYYPPKDSAAAQPINPNKQSNQIDMMANSASTSYQSMAFPNPAENGYPSSVGSAPEASASNHEASYFPQPMGGLDNGQQQLAGNGPMVSQGQQQQQNSPSQSGYSGMGDLTGYASNINPMQGPQQPSGSISFNGPSSGGPSSHNGDFMNSHSGAGQNNVPNAGGYQGNSLFNQLGDLSTSNFGNNPAGLNSVASFMPPQQSQAQQSQSQQSQHQPSLSSHDIYGNSHGFSSAASQLSQSAVSPPLGGPGNGQISQSGGSPLFGSSLFGNSQSSGSGGNLFTGQQYLNSFLSPAQYTQLTGQQIPSLDSQQLAQSQSAQQPTISSPAASGSTSGTSLASSSKRYGLGSLLVPVLAIAGLSLLIPTMSNIGTAVGRRKRSVEDPATAGNRQQSILFDSINGMNQLAKEHSIGEYMDRIDRYYSLYKNAVESEDCLNRLICEFGHSVKDVSGKNAIVTVIEKLVPNWMVGKVHLFKEAALDSRDGKDRCKKYTCSNNRQQ